MIQNLIVRLLLSAACILLAPVTSSEAEDNVILASNEKRDDSCKVSSLVGYFEKFGIDSELKSYVDRSEGGISDPATLAMNSVETVGNEQRAKETPDFMNNQEEQRGNKLAGDEKIPTYDTREKERELDTLDAGEIHTINSELEVLQELLVKERTKSENLTEQLEEASSGRKEAEASRERLERIFKQTKEALNTLLKEMKNVEQIHDKEIKSLSSQCELEISIMKKDLNAINKEMEGQDELISSLSSISTDAKDKLKQKEQELSYLKNDDCLNEMRGTHETKLSKWLRCTNLTINWSK